MKKKLIFETISIIAGVIIAFAPPPNGLEQNAMWVLGLLAWAIINWMSKAIPDFAAIFIMCSGWVVLGVLPFNKAFGSFSGTSMATYWSPWYWYCSNQKWTTFKISSLCN